MSRVERVVLGVYAAWTFFVVVVSLMNGGLSADNFTRLLIIDFFVVSFGWYWGTRARPTAQTPIAFVLRCTANALVVEFCYMFSRPVFASLRVDRGGTLQRLPTNTLIDFVFTAPAYLVIFSLTWLLINRFRYSVVEFSLLFSLGHALGDGNAFFLANPAMLIFVPYVMLNYQAANVVPFLRVREGLPAGGGGVLRFAAPVLLIPALYWVMGAAIIVVGRRFGLA